MDSADLEIRQDFDDMYACKRFGNIRWHSTDMNGSGGGVPDGFELYLLEYMLKHPESLPVDIEYTVILEAWLENLARMLDYVGAGHPGAANALAAYMTVGDGQSNAMAQALSRLFQLYSNPGVPVHTFTHLPQYLALDADPDGDTYTNLQEWEYIKLYEANPDSLADLYPQACLDPDIHGDPAGVETVTVTIEVIGEGTVYPGPGTHTFAKYPLSWPDPDCPAPACADPGDCGAPACAHPDCPDSGYCPYNVIQVTAAPAHDWAFRCWWGDLVGNKDSETVVALSNNRNILVEFVERPGVGELNLLSDLDSFMSDLGIQEPVEQFDLNGVIPQPSEQEPYPNGIPDAAELMLLQHVLQHPSIDHSLEGGVAAEYVWNAWQHNLAQLKIDVPGLLATNERVVAAYLTLGDWGSTGFALYALQALAGGGIVEPNDYDSSQSLYFSAAYDADKDRLDNTGEWQEVSQLPWTEALNAFAIAATNGFTAGGGGGAGAGAGAATGSNCGLLCRPQKDVSVFSFIPQLGSVEVGGVNGFGLFQEFKGNTYDATATPLPTSRFMVWSAPGSLIDGSREDVEKDILLMNEEDVVGVFSSAKMRIVTEVEGGSVTVSPNGPVIKTPDEGGKSVVLEGRPLDTVTVEATASTGYKVHGWIMKGSLDGNSADPRFTRSAVVTTRIGGHMRPLIVADADAINDELLHINVTSNQGGYAFASYAVGWPGVVLGEITMPPGHPVTLTAIANPGYAFVCWMDEGNIPVFVGPNRYISYASAAKKSFQAIFNPLQEGSLSIEVEGCGYVNWKSPGDPQKYVPIGIPVTVEAVPGGKRSRPADCATNPSTEVCCTEFEEWQVNGSPVQEPWKKRQTVTINQMDMKLTAKFDDGPFACGPTTECEKVGPYWGDLMGLCLDHSSELGCDCEKDVKYCKFSQIHPPDDIMNCLGYVLYGYKEFPALKGYFSLWEDVFGTNRPTPAQVDSFIRTVQPGDPRLPAHLMYQPMNKAADWVIYGIPAHLNGGVAQVIHVARIDGQCCTAKMSSGTSPYLRHEPQDYECIFPTLVP